MNKKIIIIVTIVLALLIGVGSYFFLFRNTDKVASTDEIKDIENLTKNGSKLLVAYYSATGTTEKVAQTIAKETNADVFKIEPIKKYTSDDLDWNNSSSRVSREHKNKSLRNVSLKQSTVKNFDDYDIILIGYPIWWGIAAWPEDNFVKNNNFKDKIVIPFCTAYSSGLGKSDKLLKNKAQGGDWKTGKRFSSSVSNEEVINWVKEMKLKE